MSRRALLCGYLIVAGLAARGAEAQDIRTLPARIDSARIKAEAARRALEAYSRTGALRHIRWSDSVVIARGKVKVLFNADVAPYAREGITETEKQLVELGDVLDRLPQFEFSIGPDSALVPIGPAREMTTVRYHPTPNTANNTSTRRDAESIAEVIAGKVTEVAVARTGTAFGEWNRKNSLPLDPRTKTRTDWGFTRLDVVSSKSFLGRQCYGGDVAACRVFLGFDPVSDPLTEYFDARGRRALVQSERENAIRVSAAGVRRCEEGDEQGCLTALRLLSDWKRAPASDHARRTLLARALVLGEEGAPSRLLTSTGSAGDALAAAARMPLDSLILNWQRDMRERDAASNNITLPVVVSSLLAIGFCLFLALRSPRWR